MGQRLQKAMTLYTVRVTLNPKRLLLYILLESFETLNFPKCFAARSLRAWRSSSRTPSAAEVHVGPCNNHCRIGFLGYVLYSGFDKEPQGIYYYALVIVRNPKEYSW